MTKEETMQILVVIQTAYPNYKPNKKLAIELWQNSILGSQDYHAVLLALQTFIDNDERGFVPVPGQINKILKKMRENHRDVLTGMEAWSIAYKAICNSGYRSQEEYDKLPPDIQRAVGSANQLHAWAVDENFNESVVMSQFLKSYQQAMDQREESARLPLNSTNMIEG